MAGDSSNPPCPPGDQPALRSPAPIAPAESAAPKPLAVTPDDARQERDIWWGSYAGRTMMPSFVVCGMLTLGIVVLVLQLYHSLGLSDTLARRLVYGLVGAVWLCQLSRWLYRVSSFNYRLTTRRVFQHRGILYASDRIVELTHINRVLVEQGFWERWLDVGRVRLLCDNHAPPVLLLGVSDPRHHAAEIEMFVQRARASERSMVNDE